MGARDDRTVGADSDWRGAALEAQVDRLGHHTQTQENNDKGTIWPVLPLSP